MADLPLEDNSCYERDRKAQHNSSHDEQNDSELGNRKDPAIEPHQSQSSFVERSYIETLLKQLVSPKKSAKTQRILRNDDVASRGSTHMYLPNPRETAIACFR